MRARCLDRSPPPGKATAYRGFVIPSRRASKNESDRRCSLLRAGVRLAPVRLLPVEKQTGVEMTYADRINRLNRWYDQTPEDWRAHIVLWPIVFLGFLNMQLSLASGFPFGILVLLGLLALAAIRLPYTRGWIVPGSHGQPDMGARLQFGRIDWLHEINERYEAMPELRRFFVIPAILIVAGAINMWLTLSHGWTFGGLFLLALLAIIVVRAPFAWGLVKAPETRADGALHIAWLTRINRRYDAMSSEARLWTALVVLAAVCLFNTVVSAGSGAALGLLFALEALIVVLVRAPYISGRLEPVSHAPLDALPDDRRPRIASDHGLTSPMPMHGETPEPVSTHRPNDHAEGTGASHDDLSAGQYRQE